MNKEQFINAIKEQFDYCIALIDVKGDEYNADSDSTFHNFEAAAAVQGITPKQALAGMMCKHTVSIYDMCNYGNYPKEVWREKITDHINYLLLLMAMVVAENEVLKDEDKSN